jgi:mRNA-degrading endonuclease toxin of MazEF toxin-antitoxin module
MGAAAALPQPQRGQIWSVVFPSDPPGKGRRPVLIVSIDGRNMHPHALTVLVVPFSTTLTEIPTHIQLGPGETGLAHKSELQPENVTTVRKEMLQQAPGTRMLAEHVLRAVARNIVFAIGFQPREIH